jgi:exopolysaccharide production protein ExoQ
LPRLVLYSFLILAWWLIKRDTAGRTGISSNVWIPTLWVGILASRPLSAWLGITAIRSDIESATAGSPIDMMGYLVLILAALVVVTRRQLKWGEIFRANWPIFLFYGYFLVSVAWANHPFVSFKRWFKEFGNILVVLVILTEANPLQALRAVFVRCAYVLIPLSVIFIRYFPDLGRHYNIHSGEMQAVGVTFQKNSLGAMVLVCGLILLWDCFELWEERRQNKAAVRRGDLLIRYFLLLLGAYLLHLCDSMTSLVCIVLGGCILAASRSRFFRPRLSLLGGLGIASVLAFLTLDQLFDIKQLLVRSLGRDLTFTGRTDVWDVLLKVGTDPMIGTGFCSFWDDMKFQSKLPYWVAFSAHNGYLEIYLAGGVVGVCLLVLMLLAIGARISKALTSGGDYAVLRYAVFVTMLVANLFESNFAVMSPLGFLFLLVAIGHADAASVSQWIDKPVMASPEAEESPVPSHEPAAFPD